MTSFSVLILTRFTPLLPFDRRGVRKQMDWSHLLSDDDDDDEVDDPDFSFAWDV
jgi:hypothetical protein